MKLAILSDIHGNLPALHAVAEHIDAWRPDHVIVNGDIVNRGPCSPPCLRFVQDRQRARNWQALRGNHEDHVLEHTRPDAVRNGPQFEINRMSFWTYEQLNGAVEALAALPNVCTLHAPDGSMVRVTHASMRNNRDGIYISTTDNVLRQQIAPAPAVFCSAHTHYPLIRCIDDTLVVNVGSAGSPNDGDPRASYAQLTWRRGQWRAEIMRLEYDREQTERDFQTSGFLDDAGAIARVMHFEWRFAQPFFPFWIYQYQARVLAGEIDLETAVDAFLEDYRPIMER
jgi:predicted phosphodiesterase